MSLGNNLLDLRKKKGMSQEELAEKLNVSRQTISKWETDQSQPDFDKIKPICELFEMSADELLFGTKSEADANILKEDTFHDSSNEAFRRRKKALFLGLSIFLYFVGVVWIMIGIPVMKLDPILVSSLFLLICGVATSIIVYSSIVYRKGKYEKEVVKGNPVIHAVYSIISLVFTCLYLFLSFKFMAWHITWIVWIIYAIVMEIVKLLFLLKRSTE